MRKFILPALGLLALLTCGSAAYLWLQMPQSLAEETRHALIETGFTHASLPEPESQFGQIVYKDIKLDQNGFSTIKRMTLKTNPFAFIAAGTLDSIKFEGIDLTGEVDENGSVTIAGWNGTIPNLQNIQAKAHLLSFENTRVSLLSNSWGGISLQGDAQIKLSEEDAHLQARVTGAQKQFKSDATIEGNLTDEGFWDTRIELEQGKFELGTIKASRLAGLIKLNGRKGQETQIIGELQAGGLNILDTPWQNGAITLDGSLEKSRMILAAKSSGYEGLELGLTIEDIRFPNNFSGRIHAEQLSSVFDYLASQKDLPVQRQALTALDPLASITLRFAHRNNLIFKIKDEDKTIDVKGKFKITEKKNLNGEISSAPIPLSSHPELQGHSGTLTISGKINTSAETDPIDGFIEAKLANVSFNYGILPLEKINALLRINELETLSGPSVKETGCNIPNLNIFKNCHLSMQIKNGKVQFTNLKIKGSGLSLNVPRAPKPREETLFNVGSIELKRLFDFFESKAWSGTGLLNGTLALSKENGVLAVKRLHLKNQGVGILKLTDEHLFELMKMEGLEKETMKLALENFQYDLLEIKASGTFPDHVRVSVFGKGRNPDLLQGRTFLVDFEFTPDFSPIIARLLKPAAQP